MTPRTEAGRALLYGLDRLHPEKHDDAVTKVCAIEREAATPEPSDLRAAVEALTTYDVTYGGPGGEARVTAVRRGRYVERRAVLALIESEQS